MHKKIQDLAYARFQYKKPEVEFSAEQLDIEMFPEDTCRGSFSFTSINDISMRGMIYSSNPKMECLTQDFDGTQIEVPFEFCSEGLKEGEEQKGAFTIIYNGGEYSLPFVVSVVRFYVMTSIGKVETLHDFAKLAQESYEEAYHIFQSFDFAKLMDKTEEKERLLYYALHAGKLTMQALEEFLIGIGKKQKVTVHIEDIEKNYASVTEDIRENIRIKKDQWGYLELSVTSDSKAVEPVKKRITTADFVGNYIDIEFIIRAKELHGGKNYARITIESLKQKECCEICTQMGQAEHQAELKAQKQLLTKITRLYLNFRMQRIVTGVWTKETCICLEQLKKLEPENLWYVLYQAQVLLVNKQRQEAEWLLDIFRRKPVKKDSPLYAYYLYLGTLQEREPSYAARTFSQITKIYHKNQDNIRLFLIMLFSDPELNQSRSRKLTAIKEKVSQGVHSPILYMEAYQLIRRDIYLLQKAGDFERQILYWAAKEGELTLPVTRRISQYVMQVRQFHSLWYEILKACYLTNPEPELLQTICSFCIKWNLYSEEQFRWYDKGIREELRIAGLYEAWLNSAGTEQIELFPRSVMLYFQYQNKLNDKKQALLYASIIRNKQNQKSLYEAYQKNMEQFAFEQLMAGRIDENLAILYEDVLKGSFVNEEIAEGLEKIHNTYKLTCEDSKAVKVVAVSSEQKLEKEKWQEQKAALVNDRAYIQLSSENDCILMENDRGIRYIPTHALILDRLIEPCEKSNKSDHDLADSDKYQTENSIIGLLLKAEQRMEGSTQRLEQLWTDAHELGLPTYELEERFLTQLLYTEGHTEKMEEIFRSYYDSCGQELILMAGLSYFSYQYFVKKMVIADDVFACLEQQIMLGNFMNDCCRLAYFKWLTGKKNRTEKQEKLLERFLQEYLKKKMYFTFYQELPDELQKKYYLYDKMILEYRTDPSHRVSIQYCYLEAETQGKKEELTQMYEGIFAKQFVVFFGEEIHYQITEEYAGKQEISESGSLRSTEKISSDGECAYDMLNRMMADLQENNMERLQQQYHQYQEIKQKTEEVFKLL